MCNDLFICLMTLQFNTAFSEDTQRGTDRLIRNIIQNVGELEKESKQKAGKPRADTKVAVIVRRLDATANSLAELSQFLPTK